VYFNAPLPQSKELFYFDVLLLCRNVESEAVFQISPLQSPIYTVMDLLKPNKDGGRHTITANQHVSVKTLRF
jgi:hypothetical protein